MGYRLAADAMMIAHLLYIIFVVVGGLLALRARWVLWLHVPAVAWAIVVQYFGRLCPLTTWEQELRAGAGAAGYQGSFIDHYLVPLIYPSDMPAAMPLVLGSVVLVINVTIYGWLITVARRLRRAS